MRIALGTVQFGLPYGIANQTGQVDQSAAESILVRARQHGVDTVDTAIAYGESESVLGVIGIDNFKVVTKLPAVPECCSDVTAWVRAQCLGSLDRLRLDSIYGLLLHRSQELVGPSGGALVKALEGMKADGLVKKIGVSVYSPAELETVIPVCDIDLIQAPFNLLDRRLSMSGWLTKLHSEGIEVHTRSAFIQGLLLMREENIPPKFSRWNYIWRAWHDWLDKSSTSPAQACLAFVLGFPEIDKVVVGVDNALQFDQIMDTAVPVPCLDFPELSCADEQLINPSNWNRL